MHRLPLIGGVDLGANGLKSCFFTLARCDRLQVRANAEGAL